MKSRSSSCCRHPVGKCHSIELTARAPFAWDALMDFLARRAIPGVEEVAERRYRRTARLGRKAVLVEVTPNSASRVEVRAWARTGPCDPSALVGQVRHLFDLDARPGPIMSCLSADAALRQAVERTPGLRVPGSWDPFEIGVRAILGQQVSVRGAGTLAGRFVRRFGTPLPRTLCTATLTALFPLPGRLVAEEVASIGLPATRAASIAAFAEAVSCGLFSFAASRDPALFFRNLMAIKGIGPWTANYVAMRGLHDGDSFPSGDLILLRALGDGRNTMKPPALEVRAERWRPWRAYAAMYLWREYARAKQVSGC